MSALIEKSADVIVIGAAASGLPAAIRAMENGAKSVIILDRTKQLGGCARLAAGMFAVGSQAQERYGVHLTADECFTKHMELQNWRCDAMLVRKWMLGSGKMADWMESKGVEFNDINTFNTYDGPRVYHISFNDRGAMGGNEVIEHLLKECDRIGIPIIREVRAYKLLTAEDGSVNGVLAKSMQDDSVGYRFSCKSVILCTGAISSNDELMKRFFPFDDYDSIKVMTRVPHNMGDGFIMAEELGADSVPVGELLMGPHNHPNNIRVGLLIRRPHPMTVNKYGKRFTDETLYACHPWSWFAGQSLDVQPDKICFPIYDQKILTDMYQTDYNLYGLEENQGRISNKSDMMGDFGGEDGVKLDKVSKTAWLKRVEQDVLSEAEKGRVKIANTLDEIADFIGCDANVLKEQVARYNRFCEAKYDYDFLKRPDYLLPIENPPYYCFRATQGIDTVIGPLKIDDCHRVLKKDHTPIPGLYAAGVLTGGWVNNTYSFPGSCLGYSCWSGYDAGKEVGQYIASLSAHCE